MNCDSDKFFLMHLLELGANCANCMVIEEKSLCGRQEATAAGLSLTLTLTRLSGTLQHAGIIRADQHGGFVVYNGAVGRRKTVDPHVRCAAR